MEQEQRQRRAGMPTNHSDTGEEDNQASHGIARALHFTIRRTRREIVLLLLAFCFICLLLLRSDVLPFKLTPSSTPRSDLVRPHTVTAPLRISILDMPERIREDLARCEDICTKKNHQNKGTSEEDSAGVAVVYGNSFSPPIHHQPISELRQKWPFRVLETDQFAFERIFNHEIRRRLNLSAQDDAGADFIYIPLDTRAVARCFGGCAPLYNSNHDFDRHALRRSVVEWLVKTVESLTGRRPYPSLILALSLIRHDYEGNILNEVAMEVMRDDVVILGIEGETWSTVDRLQHFRQVPYPSWLHAESSSTAIGEWQLSRRRDILLVFAGKNAPSHANGGKGPHNGYAIRNAITEELANNSSLSDIFVKIMDSGSKKHEILEIHEALASSVFAITPPGDSGTRKGFFDALLLGSIPVIFRPGTYSNVFPDLRLEDLAVIIPEQEIVEGGSLVERLRAVSRDEIRRKQESIAGIAYMMQYSVPREDGETVVRGLDATAVILRELATLRDLSSL